MFELAYGGEEKFTTSLANWLVSRSHDVILMGSGFVGVKSKRLSDSHPIEEHDKDVIPEHGKIRVLYPPYSIYLLSRLVQSLLWILKISSINLKSPITIIHAQDTGYAGLAAVLSGRFLRIPVVISSHGIRHKTLESTVRGRLKKVLIKIEYKIDIFTIKNADNIIVVNPSIKNYFERLTSKKIDYIPIGIKVRKFQFSETDRDLVRDELGIDKETKVIGFVGRFSHEKNLFTLLVAFANVVRDNSPMKLVLVGAAGPLESQIRENIRKSGIEDKVILCGIRYDINKMLSSFDIFVLPSYTEGLSVALLEAMACGRAIICSDIPANQQLVIHNKEALLVDPYDTNAFERAIRLLCNDDSLRIKLAKNARIKASQYEEEVVFPKILEYYETVSNKMAIQE